MGVTYAELSTFGILRKNHLLGPVAMFSKLLHVWSDRFSPREIYEKVRHFHYYYGINRHKTVTLTPGYFANPYSPDDKRYDLRPFLYPGLSWAWRRIEGVVERLEGRVGGVGGGVGVSGVGGDGVSSGSGSGSGDEEGKNESAVVNGSGANSVEKGAKKD